MADQEEIKMKILLIGESKVGKTCLINSYVIRSFNINQLSTVGLDFRTKKLDIQGKQIILNIYDTAGQERFRNLATGYMKSADGFLVCFDLTSESTLENVTYWINSIKNTARKNASMLIIGNKSDLNEDREVTTEQGKQFAAKNGIDYLETSSKMHIGVDEAFETLVKKILEQREIEEGLSDKNDEGGSKGVQLGNTKEKGKNKEKRCC
jgi:small GTP-binding protein